MVMLLYVSFLLSLVDGGVRCQYTDLVLVEQEPQRLCRFVENRGL